jgi:hypothetical protein
MSEAVDTQHTAEFEAFLARAGMVLPEARRAVILAGYADFRAQMDLLHTKRDASEEPSNIFRMQGAAR